nr:hypothetical protein [Ensifer adhaerens]
MPSTFGEGRVPVGAVGRHLPGCCGKGHERTTALCFDRRQPSDRGAARGTFHFARQPLGERIVAAGIEEDQRNAGAFFQRIDDLGQRHGLGRHVELAFEPCIGTDEEILSMQLHAMSGIVEQGDIVRADLSGKT